MSAALDVDVLVLAARAGIASGKSINVVFTASTEPMVRVLTNVEVQHRHGSDWLFWQWERSGSTPWGTADCGFAGNLIDNAFVAELETLAAVGGAA